MGAGLVGIGGDGDHLLEVAALNGRVAFLHHTLVADRHRLHLLDGGETALPRIEVEQVVAASPDRVPALEALGELAMRLGRTGQAIDSFERARRLQGDAFRHSLELGVLYLAARRYAEARDALDRVPTSHPGYPMALFKRAQVSVLLGEPDRAARIALARERADATTRPLVENERLFR